jgi:hypothetical protein
MCEQLNLLDWSESICRKQDPVTSFVAAEKTAPKLAGLRLQLVEGVTRLGGAATSQEAAAAMTDNHSLRESIRKRAKECVANGSLKIVGKRVCEVTGNQSQVYGLTSETP